MYSYEITMNGQQNFTEEELDLINENSITDGILCLRGENGNTIILKTNVTISVKNNGTQYNNDSYRIL